MRVVIVGSGFGGIAAAIELTSHGVDDVVLLEAASGLGGTWHHNTYPGAACDVPSHMYSYSFAQRNDWSKFCAPQPEILGYLHEVAKRYDVARRIVFDTTVTACEFDEASATWTVRTDAGREYTCDAVVIAVGQLNQPAYPRIAGIEQFAGRSFHSARWDHDYDLAGKKVAVVGTGASAVQFVPPVAEQAGELTVFQRSGNWFLPRTNHDYPGAINRAFAAVPGLRALYRLAIFEYMEMLTLWIRHPRTFGRLGWLWSMLFMRMQLRDPEVRRKVWPNYRFGCKRVLFSSYWLKALQRPNVEVVTDAITEMTPAGPRTADGRVHEVDCIIWGTGFRTTAFMLPMQVIGRGGRSLEKVWDDAPHAHLGLSVPGFPSLFVMYGPNTNTSGGSIIHYLEAQAGYIRRVLALAAREHAALDIRPEVEERSDREVQGSFAGTAWLECDSWYRDETGRIVTNWPGYMRDYARRAADVTLHDYERVAAAG